MSEWISVKDRLPGENIICLCRTDAPVGTYAEQVIGYYNYDVEGWVNINFYTLLFLRPDEPKIMYWRLLPKPPEDSE